MRYTLGNVLLYIPYLASRVFKPNTDKQNHETEQNRVMKSQENVNRHVLMEYIRVLHIPTCERISLKDQVKLLTG